MLKAVKKGETFTFTFTVSEVKPKGQDTFSPLKTQLFCKFEESSTWKCRFKESGYFCHYNDIMSPSGVTLPGQRSGPLNSPSPLRSLGTEISFLGCPAAEM